MHEEDQRSLSSICGGVVVFGVSSACVRVYAGECVCAGALLV